MKIRRRVLSAILATVLVFSSTGMSTFAESVSGTTGIVVEEIATESVAEEKETEESCVEETATESVVEEVTEEIIEETDVDEIIENTAEEKEAEESCVEETAAESVTEESVAEESAAEESAAEEVIEETTEEEIATEEIIEEVFTFEGLAEDAVLSVAEKTAKTELNEHTKDILSMTEDVDYVSGEIMVAADSLQKAKDYAAAFNGTLLRYSAGPGYALIQLSEEATVETAVVASASARTMLPAAYPNYIWTVAEEVAPKGVSGYNDADLMEQWFHEYIGSEWAWNYDYTGAGVSVGIVDTGILVGHEDLSANALPGEFYAADTEEAFGMEWLVDKDGHGTHVAGIVAADGQNGLGGCGVAPDATVKGYTVLDEKGKGTSAWVYDGFYAAIEDELDVINMSLGGGGYDSLFQSLCDIAYAKGIAVFAAAGNESVSATTYPACYDHVISIGALEASGAATSFSNFGKWVDLSFPGADIYSTYIDKEDESTTDVYTFLDGTSMACPVASGVAAVLLSADLPELEGKTGAEKVDALEAVMKSAVKKSTSGGMGAGTTSLAKALNISDEVTIPKAPVFSQAAGTYKQETLEVEISAERGYTDIYYSVNGKNPVYKNGQITNGQLYTGPITFASNKATLKAIVVNASGNSSKVTTAKYVLKPQQVREINLFLKNGTAKITKGKSMTLGVNLTPAYAVDKAVKWSVSPAGQGVTVKAGKVTAGINATPGEYTVTAEMKNYSVEPAEFVVTVEEASIKKVVLNKKKATLIRTIEDPNPVLNLSQETMVTYTNGEAGVVEDLNWSSSKPTVATVDEKGNVTALSNGKAIITALAKDGSGKKATCEVNVKNKAMSIQLSGLTEVAKGKTITLKANVQPAKAMNASLVWTVEPAGKGVKVNKGQVKATIAADPSIVYQITAATVDGTVVSDPYEVRVVESAITRIKLPQKATIFTTPGNFDAASMLQLEPVITGGDASLVEYSSSVPSVATVDSKTGLVVAKAVGKTVITCKALDGSNKSAKITVNVNIPMARMTIAPTKGLSEYIAKNKKVKFSILAGSDFGAPTNTKVKWSVEDTSIASVDSKGNVKGKSLGTTLLTAEAVDGSNVKASMVIHVVAAPSYFEAIYIGDSEYYNVGRLILFSNAGILQEPYASGFKLDITGPKINGTVACQIEKPYLDVVELWFSPDVHGTYTIKITLLDGSGRTKTIKVRI